MVEISNLEDFNAFVKSNNFVCKLSASWCRPCKQVTPLLQEIAEETGVTVLELDIDDHEEVFNSLNVRSVPTVIGFKGGEAFGHVLVGVKSKQEYADLATVIAQKEAND